MSVGIRRPFSAVVVSLCVLAGALALGSVPALAAAPETPVVVNPPAAITATTATLKGDLGEMNPGTPGEAGTYEFLYRASVETCEGSEAEGVKTAPVPAGVDPGLAAKEPESQPVNGLAPDTTYTYCLLARNMAEEMAVSAPVTFTTSKAQPTIASESVTNVEATAATLEAQIDPDGEDTTYHFEYGTSEAYGHSTPESTPIGEDNLDHTATARITGLEPAVTYHYRVVASNPLSPAGGTPGPDKILTTPVAPGATSAQSCLNEQLRAEQPYGLELPDCRAYEMVSPVEKNGNSAIVLHFEAFAHNANRASVSGEAIEFGSRGSFANPAGAVLTNNYISRRGPSGWSTQSITSPFLSEATETWNTFESGIYTPELSKGVLVTDVPLSGTEAPAGLGESYLEDFATGSYQWVSKDLSTAGKPYLSLYEAVTVVGASTDLSHLVLAAAGIPEWIEGRGTPILVGVANNGEVMQNAPLGSGSDVWHAVSSNGSRIFFASGEAGGPLYVRENPEQPQSPMSGEECADVGDACTVQVDAAEPGASGPSGGGRYWGASADGSKVFFTDESKLTVGSTAEAGKPDLYEYAIENGHIYGHLTDLTVAKAGEHADVQGVVQISEEGAYVYLVAMGDLVGNARSGAPNLYVSHKGGAPVFIATLADGSADTEDWAGPGTSQTRGGPDLNTAVVTPDGTRVAFISHRSLTGYDNTISTGTGCGTNQFTFSEEPPTCPEIFEYDAVTGQLVCVSCNPSGARPIGPSSFNQVGTAYYRPHNFSEAGVLFFNSSDALVPHASDGLQNVYEYENDHVYAISNVAGGEESLFMDASANGDNVFFATADQLVAQDRDNRVDVYDARAGGGFPVSVLPPPCDNGDSCKPPPSPQPAAFGAPASATFSGAGNPTPTTAAKPAVQVKAKRRCGKDLVKRRSRCVAKTKLTKRTKKSIHGKGSK